MLRRSVCQSLAVFALVCGTPARGSPEPSLKGLHPSLAGKMRTRDYAAKKRSVRLASRSSGVPGSFLTVPSSSPSSVSSMGTIGRFFFRSCIRTTFTRCNHEEKALLGSRRGKITPRHRRIEKAFCKLEDAAVRSPLRARIPPASMSAYRPWVHSCYLAEGLLKSGHQIDQVRSTAKRRLRYATPRLPWIQFQVPS